MVLLVAGGLGGLGPQGALGVRDAVASAVALELPDGLAPALQRALVLRPRPEGLLQVGRALRSADWARLSTWRVSSASRATTRRPSTGASAHCQASRAARWVSALASCPRSAAPALFQVIGPLLLAVKLGLEVPHLGPPVAAQQPQGADGLEPSGEALRPSAVSAQVLFDPGELLAEAA